MRHYYATHKAAMIAANRAWRRAHPEKMTAIRRAYKLRRRARDAAARLAKVK